MSLPHTSITRTDASPQLGEAYRSQGWWRDECLGEYLYSALSRRPDGRAIFLRSDGSTQRLSFAALLDSAIEIASQLRLDEDRSGDELVIVYGGNAPETCATLLGACLSGLVVLPIATHVPIVEARRWAAELGADVFLVCTPHAAELPIERNSDLVFSPCTSREPRLLPADLAAQWPQVAPDQPALIGMTAGSTGSPRAVLHSHNSILAELRQLCGAAPSEYPQTLIATPIAHAIGLLGGILMPLEFGLDIHLMETWNPRRALHYMRTNGVSCGGGLPALCESLIGTHDFSASDWATMQIAGLGGSAASVDLVDRLDANGVFVYRSFGSTEHPSVTHTGHLASETRLRSEGTALPGAEIRIVDESGNELGRGSEGYIQTRGPDLCMGFIDLADRLHRSAEDGWFDSGDFGRIDENGCLWDVARVGDVAKSHGRLVNLAKVEALLGSSGAPSDAALLAVPSARDAVDAELVLLTTAHEVDLRRVRSGLRTRGVRPNELPARVLVVDRIPLTALGKIDRRALRAAFEGAIKEGSSRLSGE